MARRKTGAAIQIAESVPTMSVGVECHVASPEAVSGAEALMEAAASVAEPVSSEVQADAAEEAVEAPAATAVPEHKSIGQWEATTWRGRSIWRHRRTKKTLHKRDEVWRLRNFK